MYNPDNNQHCNALIYVEGGGLRISTLCTIEKMLTIVNDPLKVGLYFRRRQALWHAFIRLSNAYKSVLRRICLYFSRRHQRALTRARKRSSAQDATKFNCAELSRFTPANASNSANRVTNWVCSGSILQSRQRARTGQSARSVGVVKRTWSRSKCSRDPAGQIEVFVPVSLLRTFNWIYSYRQLAVRIVVSAIAVSWLIDDVRPYRGLPSRFQIIHWPNYKLKPFANSNCNTGIEFRWQHVFRCYPLPSNMDIGSEDIDRQLNKVKIFPCLSVHIHA